MCGLTGFIDLLAQTSELDLKQRVQAMAHSLAHRGPDGYGVWTDAQTGVAFGHRRLSIIDLSKHGQQPMVSHSGQYILSYNGEIYNFVELRQELETAGINSFNGHSDTEVILEAIARWGVEKALSKFVGMFALALWDRKNRKLVLARDRMGIKPLYWGMTENLMLFGSELKALRAHRGWEPRVNREALAAYTRLGYLPTPYTIYESIQKLEPGHYLSFDLDSKKIQKHCYWDALQVAQQGITTRDQFGLSDDEATQHLDELLREATKCRMISDVPLGAFLSGGIDSSTVVALMQAQSNQPIKTFSIGFEEKGYNEAQHAKQVAEHLKTDHTELYVTASQALDLVPSLPGMYDEPFADSSQIPTHLVSQLARQHVTVSLSGDGGDELFTGYNRYTLGPKLWQKFHQIPTAVRYALEKGINIFSPTTWNRLGTSIPMAPNLLGDKLYKLRPLLLALGSSQSFYRELVSQWDSTEMLMPGIQEAATVLNQDEGSTGLPTFVDRMQYWDLMTYLPDDILTKVDRASMAVSLEARVPLLDHRVAEFAWGLPQHMKIRDGKSKWLLRQVLDRYVPSSLIDRPKMGFGIPIESWLRGPLRDWAEELLDESRLKQEGYFNPAPIRDKWQQHLKGHQNWQRPLWVILMFQAWRQEWLQDVQPHCTQSQVDFSSQNQAS